MDLSVSRIIKFRGNSGVLDENWAVLKGENPAFPSKCSKIAGFDVLLDFREIFLNPEFGSV